MTRIGEPLEVLQLLRDEPFLVERRNENLDSRQLGVESAARASRAGVRSERQPHQVCQVDGDGRQNEEKHECHAGSVYPCPTGYMALSA